MMLLLFATPVWLSVTLDALIPLILGIVATYVIKWVNSKRDEMKSKTEDEKTKKYIDIVADIINTCVIATNETYVKAMKNQNIFDAEAQKQALTQTKDAVINILSVEAKDVLTGVYGDLDAFILAKIEESVKNNK